MLSLLFILLAAIANAIMDTLQFHYSRSIFTSLNHQWWNPELSSNNKYKNGDPDQGERFLCSTTILVFLTDAWHLFQSIFLFTFTAALVFYEPVFGTIWDFFSVSVFLRVGFHLFYKFILIR